jgi:hypothetical protein
MASGDVVNTAARLQSAAPVNGIVVDETTHRSTRQAIDYRSADAVEAKGKASPIPIWEALAAHSRFGVDIAHQARTELVGRERELGIVRDVFERARHDRTPQLLTLVGVPGIGKSRLVYELRRIAEDEEELITWRQGHCLAYGDGVTMWALGEIVKAQAGILEGDTPGEVAAKIHRAVEDVLPGSEVEWVEQQLLALVGQGAEGELGGDRRGEAFAAWRRFLEALADQRPLVLVVEDLHWADESMLDFVDELVEWLTDVPLLVVGTARPELLTRRPDWAGGKLNATTVALSPLTDAQTATLIGALLARPVLAEAQQALLEHAGGNPLYAEQFAELYLERGSAEDLPLPETLQGVIAARLDGLAIDEKGSASGCGSRGQGVLERLAHAPGGRCPQPCTPSSGRIRPARTQDSIENESEYAFAHAHRPRRGVRADSRGRTGVETPRRGGVDRVARQDPGSRRDACVPLALRPRPGTASGTRPRRELSNAPLGAPRRRRPRRRLNSYRGRRRALRGRARALAETTMARPARFQPRASALQRRRRTQRRGSRQRARRAPSRGRPEMPPRPRHSSPAALVSR